MSPRVFVETSRIPLGGGKTAVATSKSVDPGTVEGTVRLGENSSTIAKLTDRLATGAEEVSVTYPTGSGAGAKEFAEVVAGSYSGTDAEAPSSKRAGGDSQRHP